MTSFTNAPVYTLYLRDTEGVQNSDNSWSWTVYWNSVFSADSQYDQYNMTHSFLQTTQVLSGVPTQFGVVVAEGLPLVMTSNSKGVVNIINSYTSVTWDDTGGYGTQILCSTNTTMISGVHSLTSSTVTLSFTQFDNSIAQIETGFVHTFKFTPILNI